MTFARITASIVASLLGMAGSVAMAQTAGTPAGSSQPANANNSPVANGQASDPAIAAPFPPLDANQQQRLDQLLSAWEQQTNSTQQLRCDFRRWQYRPGAAPTNVHYSYGSGEIRYAAPDGGLFHVTELLFYSGQDAKGQPEYKPVPTQPGEHWVCTKNAIYEFDHANKQCVKRELPEGQQALSLADASLPFLFKLNREELLRRFWVREVTPPGNANQFFIEAWPKEREMAANFRLVQVVLDREQFLPIALVVLNPNFDPVTNNSKDVYELRDIKRNQNLNGWLKEKLLGRPFIPTDAPRDYKVVTVPVEGGPPSSMKLANPDPQSAPRR